MISPSILKRLSLSSLVLALAACSTPSFETMPATDVKSSEGTADP